MPNRPSRRTFIKSLSAGAAGLSLAPAWLKAAGANDKLNIASVGVGGKGWSDLMGITASPHVNVVAICDIDEGPQHLGRAAEKWPHARRYSDWRKLLDQAKDFDAVHCATPDHMHAPVAMAAIQLGKHVYCQKPLTHTVLEARTLTEAAKKAGVVTQMGNQIQSNDFYRKAVQCVHDGVIGKVKEVYSWQSGTPRWPRGLDRPAGADPVPKGVDWNLWLGVAPERPFKEEIYHPFAWRGWQDFSNGQLGDFGCHILDPVFMALDLTAPTSFKADAPPINKESWTKWATIWYEFPGTKYTKGSSIKVTWYDGEGVTPPRELLGLSEKVKLPGAGSLLIGEKGSLLIPHVASPKLFPEEKFADYQFPELPARDHYVSWADACRGVDKTTSHFGYSGPLTEAVLLGTIGIRIPGETFQWNSADLKITNSTEANRLLTKGYRKGWEIPGIST
jgi:predicted dehydrogenase